jgi:orotidine-5'-phosphate decarboxylase
MELAEFAKEMGEDIKGDSGYSSIGVVMGATYPQEAEVMKKIYPDCFKLVPGFKAQGGTADEAVVSVNEDGFGFVANSSRGTNYAYHEVSKSNHQCDPRFFAKAIADETREERDALNTSVKKRIGKLPWE